MKNYIYLVVAVFALNSCSTVSKQHPINSQHQIIGEWKVGEKLRYVFDKDGYATIYMGDQVMGGSELFDKSALMYKIDYSNDPITLDLVHIDKSSNKERNRMAMIVKFLSQNKMQIKTFNNKTRPEKFEENDKYVFTLDRDSEIDNKDKKDIKEQE